MVFVARNSALHLVSTYSSCNQSCCGPIASWHLAYCISIGAGSTEILFIHLPMTTSPVFVVQLEGDVHDCQLIEG